MGQRGGVLVYRSRRGVRDSKQGAFVFLSALRGCYHRSHDTATIVIIGKERRCVSVEQKYKAMAPQAKKRLPSSPFVPFVLQQGLITITVIGD